MVLELPEGSNSNTYRPVFFMGPLPILFFVKCLLDIQFTIAFDVLETKCCNGHCNEN